MVGADDEGRRRAYGDNEEARACCYGLGLLGSVVWVVVPDGEGITGVLDLWERDGAVLRIARWEPWMCWHSLDGAVMDQEV